MDRFHTNICKTLYDHFKNELEPPISTNEENELLKKNIKLLVINSNLHVFDDGDMIWQKLSKNKHKFNYFDKIDFMANNNG